MKGRTPNISHLHVFGCKCFVLNNGKENLGKFDSKVDEVIFLEYSQSSKAYRVFNKRLQIVEESVHVSFDESCPKMVRKGISFNGAGASSERILNDQDETNNEPILEKEKGEIDHVSSKEEEDTQPTNEINPPV